MEGAQAVAGLGVGQHAAGLLGDAARVQQTCRRRPPRTAAGRASMPTGNTTGARPPRSRAAAGCPGANVQRCGRARPVSSQRYRKCGDCRKALTSTRTPSWKLAPSSGERIRWYSASSSRCSCLIQGPPVGPDAEALDEAADAHLLDRPVGRTGRAVRRQQQRQAADGLGGQQLGVVHHLADVVAAGDAAANRHLGVDGVRVRSRLQQRRVGGQRLAQQVAHGVRVFDVGQAVQRLRSRGASPRSAVVRRRCRRCPVGAPGARELPRCARPSLPPSRRTRPCVVPPLPESVPASRDIPVADRSLQLGERQPCQQQAGDRGRASAARARQTNAM